MYHQSTDGGPEFVLFTRNFTKFITRSSDDIRSVRTRAYLLNSAGHSHCLCDATQMEATQLAHSYLHLGNARDSSVTPTHLYLLRLAKCRHSSRPTPGSAHCFHAQLCGVFCRDFPRGDRYNSKRAVRSGESVEIHARSDDSLYRSSTGDEDRLAKCLQ